jgi:hypothetical protein
VFNVTGQYRYCVANFDEVTVRLEVILYAVNVPVVFTVFPLADHNPGYVPETSMEYAFEP